MFKLALIAAVKFATSKAVKNVGLEYIIATELLEDLEDAQSIQDIARAISDYYLHMASAPAQEYR